MNFILALKASILAAIAVASVTGYGASSEYIWSDDKGALSASECTPTMIRIEEVPFKVLYKTRGESGDYISVGKDKQLLLKNLSVITKVKTTSSPPAFHEVIKVVSAPMRLHYTDDNPYAARGTQGLLRAQSLRSVGEFKLLMTGFSAKVTGGSISKIEPSGAVLAGSRWQLASQNGQAIYFACPGSPNAKYFAFDMTPARATQPALRMGVKFSETQIFSGVSVDIHAIQESAPSPNLWNSIIGVVGLGDSNQNPKRPIAVDEDEDEEVHRGDQHAAGDEPKAPVPADRSGKDAAKPIEGPSQLIICDGSGINVRDDKISAEPIFTSRPFERIYLKSIFGKPSSIEGVVKGKKFTFKRVQFIDRTASKPGQDVSGWINQDFVSTEAGCKAFQDSLRNVVCIKSGKQWVRDANNEELFPLNPLDDIIRKSDWKKRTEKRTIDGKKYDFIPVLVPGENMAEGWIALDSLLPEADCIKKREELVVAAKGLDDPNCCSYPLKKRAWYPYTKKEDPGNKWFGGKRSGGRKHAGCDLFNDVGAPVLSVTAGVVDSNPAVFTRRKKTGLVSYDFSIKHTGGKIVRYGELSSIPSKMRIGKAVASEEKLGVVSYTSMLHFELYSGKAEGYLSASPKRDKRGRIVEKNLIIKEFMRRPDLIDPTPYLLRWENNAFGPRKK